MKNKVSNNQVCGLQYLHPIYMSSQEWKENENKLKIRRKKWNQSKLTKIPSHKCKYLASYKLIFFFKP